MFDASDSPAPRVVVVSNVSKWGGGGVVGFRDMLLAIRNERPDADVIAVVPQKGDVAQRCAEDGIEAKIAWTPWWGFGKWSRWKFADPHALVGWLPYTAILLPGIVGALVFFLRRRPTMVLTNTMTIPSHAIAAKILRIPHYWIVREFGRDDHQIWFLFGYRRTVRMVGRLSELAICNSHAVEQAMLALDPTMKTRVLYPVVDTELGTPPERQPGERMRTILVGYFSEAKGQNLAIEAIAVARKAGVDIELTLVGAGGHQPLQGLAERLGVGDLLTIHEPTRDLRPHWAAAHVGLMCSQSEAFGRVTVEAMRAGLPVCGTNSGGTPEIIEPGVAGLLSPVGDAHALAANLMTLEADEDLRRGLAKGALESSQRFGRDRHDDELATYLGLR
ncbi:glycosyltransferase involved in cell wall biosynthesis [Mycolicibacterium sp. BK556]|uniref:glycosyltransferase family 4 protein n=1 Tax=unclassified Mycolicibacterium TaxID=2636767 RepID=UPI00161B0744|nr:glycosyltransferase involved in cell wall biosynthesis [Mycolicibacterium sp. BK556]MBB3636684.1 glycosyltransferase involved in cell wall biosynthesis [Mycolicibacterium sp. BK607]